MEFYNSEYFDEGIFSTDYTYLAKIIAESYSPKKVIEFGCGPGHLTKALSNLGINVDAVDGFSNPDFKDLQNITFSRVDLNNASQLTKHLHNKYFDVAICTEVAEHLNPSSSSHLIELLTQSAPVVVFSAAVPFQGGHGHINCQPRDYWHNLFNKCDFQLADTLREKLRANENLAVWYKLNTVDYISKSKKNIDLNTTISNLIKSESFSSSLFYKANTLNSKNEAYLNKPLIKQYLQLRNLLKKVLNPLI